MNKTTGLAVSIVALLLQPTAYAAYTEASSGVVTIVQVYANEWGSPFVYVSGGLNTACAGSGLYLYDITQTSPNITYRNNKMATLLMAQSTNRQVVLDYYYDPGVTGWAACYIEGIQVLSQ